MQNKSFTLKLEKSYLIAPKVKHFIFSRTDGQMLSFIPGQFITLLIPASQAAADPASKPLRRSYSLATHTDQSTTIELAASFVVDGSASQFLFDLAPGDTVDCTGPFGRLVLPTPLPKRLWLIATGTGVTPYRSMLPALAELLQTTDIEVFLTLGVMGREHLLYGDEFAAFAEQHPKFHFHAQYSRTFPEDAKPYEQKGHVQAVFAVTPPHTETDAILLCGNPNMIDETFELLKQSGFSTQNVRREKYISNG